MIVVEPRTGRSHRGAATVSGVPTGDQGQGERATGEQYRITGGGTQAIVTGVGAGLRSLTVDGRALTETFDPAARPPLGAGGVLVPWPNRTAGAAWSWRGVEHHLDVTESARGHAIHGLLRRAVWTPSEDTHDRITLAADVPASGGWPEPLHVETSYTVSGDGLAVAHTVTNLGVAEVPVGLGTHPYLRVGDTPPADCVLTVATVDVLDVDDALIPTGRRPVTPAEDLRDGRRVGDLTLDTCFAADPERGDVLASMRAPDGHGVALWADASVRWVQVFTPDAFPRPDGAGRAVAVEPMTCPPDALHSGTDLRVLAPGEAWTVRWGLVAM